MQIGPSSTQLNRRDFIRGLILTGSVTGLCGACALAPAAQDKSRLPIVVFSKIFQELKLNYEDAAALTAEAGLDGIDCPVRPGGEVLPERVTEDLPRYAEALKRHGLTMPLLTTAITSPESPNAEKILRTGKNLGAKFYRLGFAYREGDAAVSEQITKMRAQFKALSSLNQEIGIGALVQNHSPSGSRRYLGGDLAELWQLLDGFDSGQVGAAFDIGHALIVHGEGWRPLFQALKKHIKIAYVKDPGKQGGWTPFGEGQLGAIGYFKVLKQLGYAEPLSLHIEFDWDEKGKQKNRAALLKALKESCATLRGWLREA